LIHHPIKKKKTFFFQFILLKKTSLKRTLQKLLKTQKFSTKRIQEVVFPLIATSSFTTEKGPYWNILIYLRLALTYFKLLFENEHLRIYKD
jgi:hypothetical protein